MRISLLALLAACPRSGPRVVPERGASSDLEGPWQCTAYVARRAELQIVTAEGAGEDEAAADQDAWARACAALPQAVAPEPCEAEMPPSGWTWTRTVFAPQTEGAPVRVRLVFTPEPVPFRGSGRSAQSQDQACARAYTAACAAAGAPPGCQSAPGFQDDGVEAVEASPQAR